MTGNHIVHDTCLLKWFFRVGRVVVPTWHARTTNALLQKIIGERIAHDIYLLQSRGSLWPKNSLSGSGGPVLNKELSVDGTSHHSKSREHHRNFLSWSFQECQIIECFASSLNRFSGKIIVLNLLLFQSLDMRGTIFLQHLVAIQLEGWDSSNSRFLSVSGPSTIEATNRFSPVIFWCWRTPSPHSNR